MSEPKNKPVIRIHFDSPERNIFYIRFMAGRAMREMSAKEDEIKQMYREVKRSGSYANALEAIGKYVVILPEGSEAS